jgi:hypothetical protein
MDQLPSSSSLVRMIGMLVWLISLLTFSNFASNSGDLLWALPVFIYHPQTVYIHSLVNMEILKEKLLTSK